MTTPLITFAAARPSAPPRPSMTSHTFPPGKVNRDLGADGAGAGGAASRLLRRPAALSNVKTRHERVVVQSAQR